jgi:hypothetical protein
MGSLVGCLFLHKSKNELFPQAFKALKTVKMQVFSK